MQRDLLRDEFGIPCAYREAPKGKHNSPRHTPLFGAWVYEWIHESFQQMAKGGQGVLPPELVPVDNPPALTAPLRVKFHPAESPGMEGWLSDTGKLFGPREGGRHYGWHYDCSHNFATAAKESVEPVYRSFYRLPDPRDVKNGRYARVPKAMLWEVAVPNGTYRVRLLGGDPDFEPAPGKKKEDPLYAGPAHLIDVEGASAVPADQAIPARPGATFDVAVTVEVKDGRLTISNAPLAGQVCLAAVEIAAVPAGRE
jgi:hypothetical protein